MVIIQVRYSGWFGKYKRCLIHRAMNIKNTLMCISLRLNQGMKKALNSILSIISAIKSNSKFLVTEIRYNEIIYSVIVMILDEMSVCVFPTFLCFLALMVHPRHNYSFVGRALFFNVYEGHKKMCRFIPK